MDDDKPFLDALVGLFEIFNPAESHQNFRSDDIGHANPETLPQENQLNSSLESDRNFSASRFSRETRVPSSPAAPFSSQGCGSSFDISTPDSLVGARQGISEFSEENAVNSFLVPFRTPEGDFSQNDEVQSDRSEIPSNQQNVGGSNRRPMQQNILRSTNFGTDESTCRSKENKPVQFFPHQGQSRTVSKSPSHILIERDGNEALEQTNEDFRELSSASAMFSQIQDTSNKGSDSASPVSVAGPSGSQQQSRMTGKTKTFACDVCGKDFAGKSHLQAHYRTNTGDKPFACCKCGKGFTQKGTLTRHLLNHTGERRFSCDVCGKRFAEKVKLTIHLRIHTGEKPYTCKWCGWQFSDPGIYSRHEKNCKKKNVFNS